MADSPVIGHYRRNRVLTASSDHQRTRVDACERACELAGRRQCQGVSRGRREAFHDVVEPEVLVLLLFAEGHDV